MRLKSFYRNPVDTLFTVLYLFILAVVALGLIAKNIETTKQIGISALIHMVNQKFIDKIVVVNKDKAYVYIKKEYLSEEQFKKVGKKFFGDAPNLGPHFYFEIDSVETFSNDLKNAQVNFDNEDKIFPFYETRKDVFGDILGWILPLAFFVFIWLFIMKKKYRQN